MYLIKNLKQEPINYLLLAIELKMNIETIKVLLSSGIDPNARSEALNTSPLYRAVELENIELITILLNFNADPNIPGSIDDDFTPLARAVSKKNNEIFNILIERGANVNFNFKVSSNFYAPLVQAIKHDAFDLMENLLQCGANPDGCASNGNYTPLNYAIKKIILKP